MKAVKLVILVISLLAVVLGLSAHLQSFGGQGIFTLSLAALPGVLVAASLGLRRPFGRLFAGLSLVSFLLLGMKTSDAEILQNIMMAAFAGVVLALVLLVKPERSA
jgi:hypothetical protein